MLETQLAHWGILPVVAIESASDASPLAEALSSADLPIAEITLRTDGAIHAITQLTKREQFIVGAGTVHSVEQAKQVADAGVAFVVTPGFNPKTVSWCLQHSLPIFPGVSSPTDLEMALDFGINVVKFFPAEQLGGVNMLKALHGPYSNVRFIPTGGISLTNLREYLSLPSVIACGGSWMARQDWIRKGRFDEIQRVSTQAVQERRQLLAT
ncbi:2-dehydro-3-deoxyphosphogluconate aldolase/(4S)-4-hydroxy-2-oxoglutarate aldolase [Rhodopirellula rubra]|uniref:2-dehydro-3-deoxyphosphogluconate aldolase/(4S)-4-hydroxy-2-oxoglutarate aldolase n=1 Tax=Aporhodopirellula rubra TaxID=980271 RepID=A0A7W5DYV4_9BACT|nr:bifunctional 4-hydroxy-2-oxoglutarate aldolase/2-dehydro-3-deoxy-phosphogluconate aldolase [Aporhodopirellula rubra]MBB3206177.1 2-dehydro-3-deoxyphosphogluconate aldolase/(4S)-4-hydroxy-2-oxoglutarate aldolase [Aporhodopirellula rubra]